MSNKKSRQVESRKRLDPDARFLLANERTFLAWVRTALAMVVGGIALSQLGHKATAENAIGLMVILLGGFLAVIGFARFRAADTAIRQGELPIAGREPAVQAGGILLIAIALVATRLFGIW